MEAYDRSFLGEGNRELIKRPKVWLDRERKVGGRKEIIFSVVAFTSLQKSVS